MSLRAEDARWDCQYRLTVRWLRDLRGKDWLPALLLGAAGIGEVLVADAPPAPGLQILYVIAAAWAILTRRTSPMLSAGVFLAATIVVSVGAVPIQMLTIGITFTVLPFFCAMELTGRRLVLALGALLLAVAIRSAADPAEDWGAALVDQGFVALAAAAGGVVAHYRRRVEQVAQTAAARVDEALELERTRIARELHDIVGHGMGVMVIQADSVRHLLAPGQDEVRAALVSIEQTGRESLRELRRLLGLLRADEASAASLAPPPNLDALGDLIESVRRSGLPVDLRVDGVPQAMSQGQELTAYRVVQEALTNVLRHAGHARARVRIIHDDHEMHLEIADDGRRRAGTVELGRGLLGLRERVRLYDGTFTAGPEGRCWVVRVTLPLDRSVTP